MNPYSRLKPDNLNHRLFWAAIEGDLRQLQKLIEAGADMHAEKGKAFNFAAQNGRLEIVRYLLKHGADIHAYDDLAIGYAALNGHISVVDYLLDHGINAQGRSNAALCWATSRNHQTVVDHLLKHIFKEEYWLEKSPLSVKDQANRLAQRLHAYRPGGKPLADDYLASALEKIQDHALSTYYAVLRSKASPRPKAKAEPKAAAKAGLL